MINLATKYSGTVDEVIKQASLTDAAVNHDYDFVGAQTVKVYSFDVAPMNDYKTSGMSRYGDPAELEDSVQEMTMSKKRSFTFTIDSTNAIDTPEGVRDAAKALKRQIDGAIVPEIDTYRLGVMAKNAGNTDIELVTEQNAYEKLITRNAEISDNEFPTDGRIAYVTPSFYKAIKLDDHFIKKSDLSQDMVIKGQIGEVDGIAIIMTTSHRMPAGASFIITHPMATTSPLKLADYKIHEKPQGVSGQLVEGLVYYDAFVLNKKKNAIAVEYGELGTLGLTAGTVADGDSTIKVSGNVSAGTLVYKTASSVTAPTLGADVSTWTAVPENGSISATAAHKLCVALSVGGKAVACSEVVTLA